MGSQGVQTNANDGIKDPQCISMGTIDSPKTPAGSISSHVVLVRASGQGTGAAMGL